MHARKPEPARADKRHGLAGHLEIQIAAASRYDPLADAGIGRPANGPVSPTRSAPDATRHRLPLRRVSPRWRTAADSDEKQRSSGRRSDCRWGYLRQRRPAQISPPTPLVLERRAATRARPDKLVLREWMQR